MANKDDKAAEDAQAKRAAMRKKNTGETTQAPPNDLDGRVKALEAVVTDLAERVKNLDIDMLGVMEGGGNTNVKAITKEVAKKLKDALGKI